MVGNVSPHAYAAELKRRGGSEELLAEVRRIDRECALSGVMPLYTLNHLATASNIPYPKVRDFVLNGNSRYEEIKIAKKNGGARILQVPNGQLRALQKFILRHCIPALPSSPMSYAYTPALSVHHAALRHVGARSVLMLDFDNFFHRVSSQQVYRVFNSLGYPELLSYELAMLTTFGDRVVAGHEARPYRTLGRRWLPQGAPTSGALSNYVLREFDLGLAQKLDSMGLVGTRYADDITISSHQQLSRKIYMQLIREIDVLSRNCGMRLNFSKTKILLGKSHYRILGLVVGPESVRLNGSYKKKFESDVYAIEKFGLEQRATLRGFSVEMEFIAYLWGHIAFAKGIEKTWASRMERRLRDGGVPFIYDIRSHS
jgi:RNA-directed DNA polymerase